jgi:hypothetical protein
MKIGIIAIVFMLTLLIGYSAGFIHCQAMWEDKIKREILSR